jgi:pyruvate,water dikinase
MPNDTSQVVWFEELRRADVPRVGGKNASLGEMVANLAKQGVKVPPGFAVTADAYRQFIDANGLQKTVSSVLSELAGDKLSLAEAGAAIRGHRTSHSHRL